MNSANPRRTRLAVVLSHPIQYYSPWFRWIAANTGLTLSVFYLSDVGLRPSHDEKFGQQFAWDVDLTSGYDWELVPNLAKRPDTLRYSGLHNPGLPAALERWKPDAILLFGYKYRTHLRLIGWARKNHVPLIFRGDSHLIGRARLPLTKRLLLRLLYAQFSAVTYVGQANREYFRTCGVPDRKLFFAPHAVDDARFDPADPTTRARAAELRRELDLPQGVRVGLFAGKLIPAKQPAELLSAYLRLQIPNTALIVAGDGAVKPQLLVEAARHPEHTVRFLPFANQSEMPARYLAADFFVLPSRGVYETWGLAVNEAMHLGLPCLVSDHVGCQRDLVTDGETGWVFDADDPGALERKLAEAYQSDSNHLRVLGEAARERVSHYTYRQATDGLHAAIDSLSTQFSAS